MKRMTKRALRRAAARVVSRKHFRAWLTPESRRKRIRPYAPEGEFPFAAYVLGPNLARPITDLPGGETSDGLITVSGYNDGFTVRLGALADFFPDPDEIAGYEIFHLKIGHMDYKIDFGDYPDDLPDPIEFDIPGTFIGNNEFDHVTFDMTWYLQYGDGGASNNGLPAKLTIDTKRPGPGGAFLAPPIFPEDIVKNGITSKTFADANYIEARVPGYSGEKPADWVRPYVDGDRDTDDTHFSVVPWQQAEELTLRFYRSFIEAQGDGLLTFQYDVMPREENPSELSQGVEISVSLADAIDDLAAPAVPAYDDDPDGEKIINEADARARVIVNIPSRPEITDTDSIQILLDGEADSEPVRVGNPDNIAISVAYGTVLAAWLAKNEDADDVAVPIDVTYKVIGEDGNERGESAAHRVEINLRVAGGIVDPDPGTEPNDNLIELETRSASNVRNRIPLADLGKDATARVPKLSKMEDGSGGFAPAFGEGDIIRIIAQTDTEVARHTVVAADLTPPGGDLSIPLLWTDLEKLPGGDIPFAYWIDTTLAGGGTNTNKSPLTNVLIEDASALPGGGTLPALIIPERGDRAPNGDTVPLFHIVNGVAIGFPVDITNFDPKKDTITLSLPMFRNRHSDGEKPEPGYDDVKDQNRFVLEGPHEVRDAESGDVAEPSSGETEYSTRPPITVPHILFRLPATRLPELHGSSFYHTHVVWTIENSVGVGTSPTDSVNAMKLNFETRGTSSAPSAATPPSHVGTTAAANEDSDGDLQRNLAWILRRLKRMLS